MEISFDDYYSSSKKDEENQFQMYYEIISDLGQGSFGKVIKAREKDTQRIVAIKQIPNNKQRYNNIWKEINIISSLNHPNIISYDSYIETKDTIYLIMEYMAGGTLSKYILNNKNEITEESSRIIIKQLLSSVAYLHKLEHNICHRDIKPDNIMLKYPGDITNIKILDFGLSISALENLNVIDNSGTLIYMAPEQIKSSSYSKTVDIWSIGIIMFILLNKGKHPFYKVGDNSAEIIDKITNSNVVYCKDVKITKIARMLIEKLWNKNPSYRYSAFEALDHPWITMNKYSEIPKNILEKIKTKYLKSKMRVVLYSFIFWASQRTGEKTQWVSEEYENNVLKTNQWYEEVFRWERDRMFELSYWNEAVSGNNTTTITESTETNSINNNNNSNKNNNTNQNKPQNKDDKINKDNNNEIANAHNQRSIARVKTAKITIESKDIEMLKGKTKEIEVETWNHKRLNNNLNNNSVNHSLKKVKKRQSTSQAKIAVQQKEPLKPEKPNWEITKKLNPRSDNNPDKINRVTIASLYNLSNGNKGSSNKKLPKLNAKKKITKVLSTLDKALI